MKHSLTKIAFSTAHPFRAVGISIMCALLAVSGFAQNAAPSAAPAAAAPPTPGAPPIPPPAELPAIPGGPARPLKAPATTPPLAVRRPAQVTDALIAEETNSDPSKAAEQYRALIARFDAERPDMAQAIFRLGECLRKLGRVAEAQVQYARVLREFVDQTELVKLAQKRLSDSPPIASNPRPAAYPDAQQTVDDLLAKEVDLVREQISQTEARVASGVEPSGSLLPLRRELLRLEQERAARAEPSSPAVAKAPAIDTRSRELIASEEDARAIDAELRKQRFELQKLSAIKAIVEKTPVEKLSTRIIDDPRFQQLKRDYETVFTQAAAGEDKESATHLEQAKRSLEAWVNEIFLPGLSSSVDLAENQIKSLLSDRDAIEAKIQHEEAQQKKRIEEHAAKR
jgi:hypothetical protein